MTPEAQQIAEKTISSYNQFDAAVHQAAMDSALSDWQIAQLLQSLAHSYALKASGGYGSVEVVPNGIKRYDSSGKLIQR